MAKRSGKSSGSAPRITPRRQAAIDAYTKATGRAPPRSMSIKAMDARVQSRQMSRAQVSETRDILSGRKPPPPVDFMGNAMPPRRNALSDGPGASSPSKSELPPNKGGPARANPIMKEGYDRLASDTRRAAENQTGASRERLTKLADQYAGTAAKYAGRPNLQYQGGPSTSETVPKTRGLPKEQRAEALRKYASGRATWGMSSPERSLAQAQENRLTYGARGMSRPPSDPKSVFHQIGVTNDAAMGHAGPVAQSPSLTARAKSMMPSASTVSTAMMATGIAVAAGRGYRDAKAEGKSTGEAVVAGAKSAAVPAAIAAAPAIAKGAGHVATGAFELSGALLRDAGGFTDLVTSLAISKAAIGTGALGVAAKGVEFAAKGVSRVAMPALAAYSGYQGAKEAQAKGESMTVGAARGVVRAFDPSAIFMKRGVGERVFDAGVNAASRLSSGQQRSFAQANAHYVSSHMGHDDSTSYQVGAGKRGFGNPVNQAAAQRAKGNKYEGPIN